MPARGIAMIRQPRHGGRRRKRAILVKWLRGGLVSFLAGCQAVPANMATCDQPDWHMPRKALAAGQVTVDTAMEIGRRPLRSVGGILLEPVVGLPGVAAGL